MSDCVAGKCGAAMLLPEPFILPPVIEPAESTAGSPLIARVVAGDCVFFTDAVGAADVVRKGSDIDLVIDGVVAADNAFCNSEPFTYTFALGALPPGQYSLRVVVRHEGPPPELVAYDEARANFTVGAFPVPALRTGGVAILVLLFAAAFQHSRRDARQRGGVE